MSTQTRYKAVVLHADTPDRESLVRGLEEAGFDVTLEAAFAPAAALAGSGEYDLAVFSLLLLPREDAPFAPILHGAPDLHVMVVSPQERSDEGMELIEKGARTAIPWPHSKKLLKNALVAAVSRIEQERHGSRMEELAELWEIAKAMTSGRATRELLEMILDSALRVTRALTGSIMLVEENREEMLIAASRGIPNEVVRSTKVKVGQGISGWVAKHGEPLLLREGHEDFNRFKDFTQRSHIRSSLCMPIKSTGGRIMGTLSLNHEKGPLLFTSRDLNLMTIYAAEAGAVIQGAQTLEELQFTHDRLRHSHDRLKSIQAQLVQSAKMAAVGMLASGIAHEFNNLLTGILGMAQLAQHSGKADHMEKALRVAISNSDKAKDVVKNLLRFSAQFKKVREPANLCDLVDETLGLVVREMEKANVEVTHRYLARPTLPVNRGEIQQVVLNLLINAMQSMEPEGGKLDVEVRKEGRSILVRVSDSGCGIPEENLQRIFDPFFSTKSLLGGGNQTQGSGLGLSVSYGIIKGHGGRILVESSVGRGTVFTVELPETPPRRKDYTDRKRKKDSTRLKKMKAPLPREEDGPIRVLVVDDEWWVREFLKDTLFEAGCEVFTADGGEAGLRLFRDVKPAMAFLDLVMPGIKGEKLAEQLLHDDPSIRIVLMSGKLEPLEIIEKSLESGIFAYLRKPFEVQDVFNVLQFEPPVAGEGGEQDKGSEGD